MGQVHGLKNAPFLQGEQVNQVSLSYPAKDTVLIHLSGTWTKADKMSDNDEVIHALNAGPTLKRAQFDTSSLTEWDSSFLTFLVDIEKLCAKNNITFEIDGLPRGAQKLLKLASAVPEREGARSGPAKESFLETTGGKTLEVVSSGREMLSFLGDAAVAFAKFVTGHANFRRGDLFLFFQQAGSQAFFIVSLISLLVGLILAFVGAVQLKAFGAQIYVADLVGIAMVRVMGAIMTGIIMAGRTGASYAAQLGTMHVNEEIDAFRTLGISPMEFLVLPRMLALIVMMPLLCVYADVMGILGGLIVGVFMLDLNASVYLQQTRAALSLTNVWIGLFHSCVFGVIVALAGCLRGIQCGRSASAVGEATTSAVVTGIVSIIIATAIITVVCNVLGI
jgi:phospholipid/cholesterol/gamma-HCH transport system permease protein